MEFTQKDRTLILKLAKANEELKKNHESRLKKLEKAVFGGDPLKLPVKSDVFSFESVPEELEDENLIEIIFKDELSTDSLPIARKIIAEAIYSILQKFCNENKIESLKINLKTDL